MITGDNKDTAYAIGKEVGLITSKNDLILTSDELKQMTDEQVKKIIGVSPQETAVAPNLTVEENLELICGIHGFEKGKTETKGKRT